MSTPTPTRSTDSLRTRPLTQFQGIVLGAFIFLVSLGLSIPLSVGQYRLADAQDRLQETDQRVCATRKQVAEEHNQLAKTMADLERKDTTHSTQQRESIAQAWEDSLLPPITDC